MRLLETDKWAVSSNSMVGFHSPFLPMMLPAPIPAGRALTAWPRLTYLGASPLSILQNGQFIGFQWFDPGSYGPAVPGTFGTCGVGTVRGPGLRTWDLSVQKGFPLSESKRLEFRAEFFNVTNTPILNSPYTSLNFNLGLVNTSQGERNIQFALSSTIDRWLTRR